MIPFDVSYLPLPGAHLDFKAVFRHSEGSREASYPASSANSAHVLMLWPYSVKRLLLVAADTWPTEGRTLQACLYGILEHFQTVFQGRFEGPPSWSLSVRLFLYAGTSSWIGGSFAKGQTLSLAPAIPHPLQPWRERFEETPNYPAWLEENPAWKPHLIKAGLVREPIEDRLVSPAESKVWTLL